MAPILSRLSSDFGFGKKGGPVPFSASGGTISTPGDGYIYHVFTSSGSFITSNSTTSSNLEFVLLGGGGAGGNGGDASAGGGGSGGLVYGIVSSGLSVDSYPVVIGPGGTTTISPATVSSGTNSTITFNTPTITAQGGGAGATRYDFSSPPSGNAQSGGSGGGGCRYTGDAPSPPRPAAPGAQPTQNPENPLIHTQYGQSGTPAFGTFGGGAGGSANAPNSNTVNATFPNSSTILSGSPIGPNSIGRGGYGTGSGSDSFNDGSPWPGTSYGSGGYGGRNLGGNGINGVCVIRYPSSMT